MLQRYIICLNDTITRKIRYGTAAAVPKGGWNTSDYHDLYKMNIDGLNVTKLTNDESYFINISGDRIYYKNNSDNGSMYSIRIDGTDRKKVTDEKSYNINISGGYIYYKTDLDFGETHKVKISESSL